MGRFINADAFAATGQGLTGNNMFAYCGNNPVIRSDETGTYYTPGQIHDFVVNKICDGDSNKESDNTYVKYKEPIKRYGHTCTYGFCDIYDTYTHEMWEVKRASLSISNAIDQLINYVINSEFVNRSDRAYYVGGTYSSIEPNYFTKRDSDGSGTYHIVYWDAGQGIVYYDYVYIPSAEECATSALIGVVALGLVFWGGFPAGAVGGLVLA